jgi:ribonuclease Z
VVQRIEKLRPEFRKLTGSEIGARRRAGDDLFNQIDRPELAYATDTLAKVLDRESAILEAKVLILECTFLDERKSIEATHAGCHIHLDELIERADTFANNALVLMHFSQIYKPAAVHEILAERCPASLRERIVAFAPADGDWPG